MASSGSRGRAGGEGRSQAWAGLRQSCQGAEGVGVTALIEHRLSVSGKHPACRHAAIPCIPHFEGPQRGGWGRGAGGEMCGVHVLSRPITTSPRIHILRCQCLRSVRGMLPFIELVAGVRMDRPSTMKKKPRQLEEPVEASDSSSLDQDSQKRNPQPR